MSHANQKIRSYAKEKNVWLWEIAEQVGVNDGNFSRKLRRELPDEERERIMQIIDEIHKNRSK